jgi:predicted dehydrogenase
MIAIADLVRGGALGRVRTSIYDLVATFANDPAFASQRYWSFHHSASEGGGLLPQVASHHIDLHLYCLGAIQACGGYLATLVSERPAARNSLGARTDRCARSTSRIVPRSPPGSTQAARRR